MNEEKLGKAIISKDNKLSYNYKEDEKLLN